MIWWPHARTKETAPWELRTSSMCKVHTRTQWNCHAWTSNKLHGNLLDCHCLLLYLYSIFCTVPLDRPYRNICSEIKPVKHDCLVSKWHWKDILCYRKSIFAETQRKEYGLYFTVHYGTTVTAGNGWYSPTKFWNATWTAKFVRKFTKTIHNSRWTTGAKNRKMLSYYWQTFYIYRLFLTWFFYLRCRNLTL